MKSKYMRRTDRLKYCRESSPHSNEKIAKDNKVSVSTLFRWEDREHGLANIDQIMRLAQYYDKSFPWLSFNIGRETLTFEGGKEEQHILGIYRNAPERVKKAIFELILAISESKS